MRLGLFGGSFDPVHGGHVEAALAAAEACRLDRVLVIPSGHPPHKHGGCRADYEHRYGMVSLACKADRRLRPSRLEQPRASGKPHYSIDTVDAVIASMAHEPPLRLILGADAFADLASWKSVRRVVASVSFVVVTRKGYEAHAGRNAPATPERIVHCAHPASSRLVRHRAKIGGSLADLAPPKVCAYIWEHGLYRAETV